MPSKLTPRQVRLIALDIDDTLTGADHRISPANREAVVWAMSRGVKATVITGRRYTGSAAVHASFLGLGGPVGVHFGRRIVDHPTGRILQSHPIPPEAARFLAATSLALPGALVSVFFGDELVFNRFPDAETLTAFAQVREGDLEAELGAAVSAAGSANPGSEVMSMNISSSDPATTAAVARAVAEAGETRYPGRLRYHFVAWAGAERGMVTVVSAAADKGTALLEIAHLAGIDPAETVAMGDSEADIPMLRAAGVGVAMPWAAEEVRAAADLVAEGEPEDAVARAIRGLLG